MTRLELLTPLLEEADFFDRQKRIEGWDQERLRDARVMVAGAGALGNEVLKNLALLGFANLVVVDMDDVEASNLSRTVLFGPGDVGRPKARVAAVRTRELCLQEGARVEYCVGDLVWEIGNGLFRSVDVVLGCLDNVEARLAINRQCSLAGTPWIDAGMSGLAGRVCTYHPPDSPCYRCSLSRRQLAEAHRRYSCDDFKRKVLASGKAPTVQVTSALLAALQVQEAAKYLCGMAVELAVKYTFIGTANTFYRHHVPRLESCPHHLSYPRIERLSIDRTTTLGAFLQRVGEPDSLGEGATLDLSAERSFVLRVRCRGCSRWIDLHRPRHQVFDADCVCTECQGELPTGAPREPTATEEVSRFSLEVRPQRLLDMPLGELGVPLFAVLPVRSAGGDYRYFELTGDRLDVGEPETNDSI